MEMIKFLVTRPHDTVLVFLMKNKSDGTYSYVNITKGHICTCRFATIQEALKDMETLKEKGEIVRYEVTP